MSPALPFELRTGEGGTFDIWIQRGSGEEEFIAECYLHHDAEHLTACANACEGYDPARIPDMLRTARELLECAATHGHIDELEKLVCAAMKAFSLHLPGNQHHKTKWTLNN